MCGALFPRAHIFIASHDTVHMNLFTIFLVRNVTVQRKINISVINHCGLCVGLTALQPSMSRLSRQCGILNISQPYRPPRPVTEIALLFINHCIVKVTNKLFETRVKLKYFGIIVVNEKYTFVENLS
jgi:hypothetical protein